LIYRRFALIGSVIFFGCLSLIVVLGVMVITWRGAWVAFGSFVANLDILAASSLVAVLAVLAGLGGYLTIRRITV
jgi:hypothetical protein